MANLLIGAFGTADGIVILPGGGSGGGPGSDTTAIHDNVASEISAIANKAVPAAGDLLVIEDSAAANVKKRITIGTLPAAAPAAHAASHQNGGSDEISVAGLSGLLADAQTPTTHAASHENGGGDEISVAGLSGLLADDQNAVPEAGIDLSAIHDDIAGEIAAIANKATPVGADYLLIEDSADANNKKHILISALPTTTPGTTKDANGTSENVWANRANETPTIGAFAGQTNLGSENAGGYGTNGDYATIAGGQNNIASGTVSFVGGGTLNNCGVQYGGIVAGYNNSISANSQGGGILVGQNNVIDSTGAQNAILGGDGNNVTGGTTCASILGGANCVVQGDYSIGAGEACNLNHARTFLYAGSSSGAVDSLETNQAHFGVDNGLRISNTVEEDGYVLKVIENQTTDATVTTAWSLTLSDNTALYVKARMIALETDGSNRAVYDLAALIYRDGAGATLQGAVQVLVEIESDAAWNCTIDVDTNDARLRITGDAATTINWRGRCEVQQAS